MFLLYIYFMHLFIINEETKKKKMKKIKYKKLFSLFIFKIKKMGCEIL